MLLPYMQNTKKKAKEYIIGFLGLNMGDDCKDGEFSETLNLSSSNFPCLTQRQARSVYKTLTAPTALFANNVMCYVDGTKFFYNGLAKGDVSAGGKQIVSVNTKVIIWPDKLCYDTVTDTIQPLELSQVRAVTFAQTAAPKSTTVTTSGAAFNFRKGDAVKLSGCTAIAANNDVTAIIRNISADGKTLTFDPLVFTDGTESAVFTREVPDMDYICEWNNRLWGCGGGKIYSSALGDPFNFNIFDGLSTDSYAVVVGSDGEFTGISAYSTHLMFHKENCVHKIYGSKPSNYDMVTGKFPGIMAGCNKSVLIINEVLYYMSRQGVVSYTGSIAHSIFAAFGTRQYRNAVAGSDGEKYYISMQDEADNWGLFAFDVKRGLWLQEDAVHAVDFALVAGELYFLSDNKIYLMNSGAETISWSATFCRFYETITEVKGYSRLTMRVELEAGSKIDIEVAADAGAFKLVKTIEAAKNAQQKVCLIPIIPTRCDSFCIRLSGTGRSRIYALTREFNVGSELR